MPDLCTPTRGVRHDLDSALSSLLRMGIPAGRVIVRSAGPGWPERTVVRQDPAAGTGLGPSTRIVLSVAGAGGVDALPYALRDGTEGEFGAEAIFAIFDNPVLKLVHHVREAGQFLAIHPDEPAGARRWISDIFSVDPSPWPKERWYPIARLLPTLHEVAGRADAVTLAMRVVFGLPVARVRTVAEVVPMAPERQTRIGTANTRLGIDTVAGAGAMGACRLEVVFGPVDLDDYYTHATSHAMRVERDALYRLVLPAHLAGEVMERWVVGDAANPPRLGHGEGWAMLGVNARLGAEIPSSLGASGAEPIGDDGDAPAGQGPVELASNPPAPDPPSETWAWPQIGTESPAEDGSTLSADADAPADPEAVGRWLLTSFATDQGLRTDPADVQHAYDVGLDLFAAGAYEQAIPLLATAATIPNVERLGALEILAASFFELERLAEAEPYLRALIPDERVATGSEYAPLLYWLGRAGEDRGDVERAIRCYASAAKADPGMQAAKVRLGSLLKL